MVHIYLQAHQRVSFAVVIMALIGFMEIPEFQMMEVLVALRLVIQ